MAALKEQSLRKQALAYELEPSDYVRGAGDRPPQRAFQLLGCGYDLLTELADPAAFPVLGRRGRRRGPKLLRKNLIWGGGGAAALLLGHAMPTLFSKMGGRLTVGEDEEARFAPISDGADGPPLSADEHLRVLEVLSGYYALTGELAYSGLEGWSGEFTVFEQGAPRGEVSDGSVPAMPYSAALLRGEDPSQDPALVAEQRRFARDCFINEASLKAVQFAIGFEDWPLISDYVIRIAERPQEPAVLRYRAGALEAWIKGSRSYLALATELVRG